MWQPMTLNDLENVYLISQSTWADYGETFDIYKNKFITAPNGCYVYKEDNNNSIRGYIISHPWNIHYPPPQLNTPLMNLNLEENCWFIHDIVILPECRGAGIGDEIIRKILNDNSIVSLVAADDETIKTKEFWTKYGFEASEHISCSYGVYMIRTT